MKHPEWKYFTAKEMRNRGATYKQISVTVRVPESTVRSWWSHRRPSTRSGLHSATGRPLDCEMGRDVLAQHDDRLFVPVNPIPFSPVSIMQRYSDDLIRKAIKMRRDGRTLPTISAELNVPLGTVSDWFYGYGRAKRLEKRDEAEAKTEHDHNNSFPGIAANAEGQDPGGVEDV